MLVRESLVALCAFYQFGDARFEFLTMVRFTVRIWSLGLPTCHFVEKRMIHPRGYRAIRNAADAVRTLSCATAAFASSNPSTVHALAGIGRSPNVITNAAGVFNLDVQSGDDAFAPHKAGNAATVAAVAAGIRHVGVWQLRHTRPAAALCNQWSNVHGLRGT